MNTDDVCLPPASIESARASDPIRAKCVLTGLRRIAAVVGGVGVIATAACTQGSGPVTATLPPVEDVAWNFDAGPRPDGTQGPDADASGLDVPADVTEDAGLNDAAADGSAEEVQVDTVASLWSEPQCETITGTSRISFSRDEGTTVASREKSAQTTFKGGGIIAMTQANTLLAASGTMLLLSEDAGCVWSTLGELTGGERFRLVTGPGDVVWAWSPGSNAVHRVMADSATIDDASPDGVASLAGLSAHATDPDRATLVAQDGRLYVTVDGGKNWLASGTAPLALTQARTAAFHPTDANRLIVGFVEEGFAYTTNGGSSWEFSDGLSALGSGDVYGSSVVFSAADPNVVWAIATDAQQQLEPSSGRHLYRSEDGGATFEVVTDNAPGDGVTLENGALLAPHPTNSALVYAFFGTPIDGYGTDVYRYDHTTGSLTIRNNSEQGIGAVAFNPVAPDVMYFALNHDDTSL